MIKVDVCIITYNRLESLTYLLEGLDSLVFNKNPEPCLSIIVIDNDPEGSAKKVVKTFASRCSWPVHYYIENNRGIPQARNRAIKEVRSDTNLIAFIDDDEIPAPQWLDELIYIQKKYDAEIVIGPVAPKFISEPPKWILDGGWFNRKHYPDGQNIFFGSTSNVLLTQSIFSVDCLKIPFNEEMALTGGSDWHFFTRAMQAGFKIHWAEKALVYEWIPSSRMSASWLLMRAFRTAYVSIYIDMITQPLIIARLKRFFLGLARIVAGLFLLLPSVILSLFKGQLFFFKAIRIIFRGAGMLVASLGIKYEEYKKIHKL